MSTGWVADVIPDEPIESVWGNTIRDRTITPFTNAAERNAAIPIPEPGMTCLLLDTAAIVTYYDPPGAAAAGWYRPWTQPWGLVKAHTAVGTITAAAGAQIIPGSAVVLAATPIGRRVRYLATLQILCPNGAAFTVGVQRTAAVSEFYGSVTTSVTNATRFIAPMQVVFDITEASQSVQMICSGSGGASAVEAGYFHVEDVGPVVTL